MKLDLRMASERVAYSADRHYRGKVCIHNHDHGGFSWRHNGHRNCVDCTREGARRWKAANPERSAENTRRRDTRRHNSQIRERWPIAAACSSARARSRELGIPCDLRPDDLRKLWVKQEGKCYWTGLELSFDIPAQRHPLKPSMDRLVPELGYVNGNVVWASNFANRARSDCPADEFREIMAKLAAAYRKHSA